MSRPEKPDTNQALVAREAVVHGGEVEWKLVYKIGDPRLNLNLVLFQVEKVVVVDVTVRIEQRAQEKQLKRKPRNISC